MNQLLINKHEKFFNRCLIGLPSTAQSEDSNKLAIIYFCLHGLQLIQKFQFTNQELIYYRNFIINQFMIENNQIISFRSTHYFQKTNQKYDCPNLSSTLFALYNLLILKSPYHTIINRKKIMNFLCKCQVKDGINKGGFVPTLYYNEENGDYKQYGEPDLRVCYMALLIRHLMKYDDNNNNNNREDSNETDIDLISLQQFILDRININGGFSSTIMDESHLGFTFCAIASLKLLNYPLEKLKSTKEWLIHRQVDYPENLYPKDGNGDGNGNGDNYEYYRNIDIGGFNGRENKLSDTCYSWWCTGSLYNIDVNFIKLVDLNKAEDYLLNKTQNQLFGGFGRDPDSTPDPMHSYLALASLSLWNHEKFALQEINPILTITKELYQFFKEEIKY